MAMPEPGDIVGSKYRVGRPIGKGGMGAVYEAINTSLGMTVALKWLFSQPASSDDRVDRLKREARATARVHHPNLVRIHDLCEGESMFLVMELLKGETLGALLARHPIPVSTLLTLLIPAMRGVAAVHHAGVVHRDVKPENIFLAYEQDRAQPRVKVIDFGIAKVAKVDGDTQGCTQAGFFMGTPAYTSPEQLDGSSDLDKRADVYSFAATLYLELTGQAPFEGTTRHAVSRSMGKGMPARPHDLVREIPEPLSQAVMSALEVSRDRRTPDLETFIEQLEPFAKQAPVLQLERDDANVRWAPPARGDEAPLLWTFARPVTQPGTLVMPPPRTTKRTTPVADGRENVLAPPSAPIRKRRGAQWAVLGVAVLAGVFVAVARPLATGKPSPADAASRPHPALNEATAARETPAPKVEVGPGTVEAHDDARNEVNDAGAAASKVIDTAPVQPTSKPPVKRQWQPRPTAPAAQAQDPGRSYRKVQLSDFVED